MRKGTLVAGIVSGIMLVLFVVGTGLWNPLAMIFIPIVAYRIVSSYL